MAFDLVAAGGYGFGAGFGGLGDVTDPTGQINSIAVVQDYNGQNAIFEVKSIGIDGGFKGNDSEVLFYIGSISDIDDGNELYGKWVIASISTAEEYEAAGISYISVSFNEDFVEKGLFPSMRQVNRAGGGFGEVYAISIPHFRNLTLNTGCYITPSRAGCPLVFKCSETLTLNGGHIDLRNKGDMYSPWFNQELNGKLDTDKYSGWENSYVKDRIHVNSVDGAAFIIAQQIVIANASSRIGNPNFTGVQFCRGAADSYNLPSGATNIGGSTIMLVADTITGFTPALIAKYRDDSVSPPNGYEAKGLAACYIASNTVLRNDEGLYAYDCISNPDRLSSANLNIKSFGDGSFGTSSLTSQINNYAQITAIDSTRKVLTVTGATTAGAAPFAIGALVMVHFTNKDNNHTGQAGRFMLAKILGINGDDITLDTALPTALSNNFANYACQLITIPQFSDYTLSETNSATPKFDGSKGGIFAIAVSNTCDLRNGKINVEQKGGGIAYGRSGLAVIGNAQDNNKLPIGQGHGSVFILANKLVMNSATRIGATYSGANLAQCTDNVSNVETGGYRGNCDRAMTNREGWGGGGGGIDPPDRSFGGYGSDGYRNGGGDGGRTKGFQGAHIMIIADTVTGFNQTAVSTGGADFEIPDVNATVTGGGAGYGGQGGVGGSGYNGGGGGGTSARKGGGSSGWAFVYCNNVVNQDTTDTIIN